jgi:hypothetical protein
MDKNNPNRPAACTPAEHQPVDPAAVQETAQNEDIYRHTSAVSKPTDISQTLKPPILPNVDPDAISHEEAHAGISVHIPGALKMCTGDEIIFYWGRNASSTVLFHRVPENSVVRVLCISYNFVPYVQYGLVDLYYEVYRSKQLIGTSPVLRVNVNCSAPVTPKQRQRKRSVSRRYPGN